MYFHYMFSIKKNKLHKIITRMHTLRILVPLLSKQSFIKKLYTNFEMKSRNSKSIIETNKTLLHDTQRFGEREIQ